MLSLIFVFAILLLVYSLTLFYMRLQTYNVSRRVIETLEDINNTNVKQQDLLDLSMSADKRKVIGVDTNREKTLLMFYFDRKQKTMLKPISDLKVSQNTPNKYNIYIVTKDTNPDNVSRVLKDVFGGSRDTTTYIAVDETSWKSSQLYRDIIDMGGLAGDVSVVTTPPAPFVIAYYGEISTSDFLTWMRQQPRRSMPYAFVEYLADDDMTRSILQSKYPYARFPEQSAKVIMDPHVIQDFFFRTFACCIAYTCEYNELWRDPEFVRISQHVSTYDQHFYEMFFDYHDEALKYYGMPSKSVKALREGFTSDAQVIVAIDTPIKDIQVKSMIRNVFTEISIPMKDIHNFSGFKLRIGDRIDLSGQESASLNDTYFVTYIDDKTSTYNLQSSYRLALEKYQIIKTRSGPAHTTFMTVQASALPQFIRQGNPVFVRDMNLRGVVMTLDNDAAEISLTDDIGVLKSKEYCFTNSTLLNEAACKSDYDALGYLKRDADVWDRPCEYDNDCPFFMKGRFQSFRGGCLKGACEMPVDVRRLAFRAWEGKPLCKSRGSFTTDECLNDGTDDYVFPGDVFDRHALVNK